jgi:hypothetical protein
MHAYRSTQYGGCYRSRMGAALDILWRDTKKAWHDKEHPVMGKVAVLGGVLFLPTVLSIDYDCGVEEIPLDSIPEYMKGHSDQANHNRMINTE